MQIAEFSAVWVTVSAALRSQILQIRDKQQQKAFQISDIVQVDQQ